jgi:hypothetical protein
MIKTNEERIKAHLENLKNEYAEKPVKRWHSALPKFILTRDFADPPGILPTVPDQTIIRYDLKRALKSSALFLCFGLIFGLISQPEKGVDGGLVSFLVISAAFVLYKPLTEIKRKPKLVLTKEGIWFHDIGETITWKEVVASYIKIEEDSESKNIYLNIHYYSQRYDIFYLAEIKLDDLDINPKILAAEIEYRKRLAEV